MTETDLKLKKPTVTKSEPAISRIRPIIANKKLIPGVVYIVFSCGCIFTQEAFVKKKKIFKRKNGSKKNVCNKHPSFENEYLGRYRRCARCGVEDAAKKGRGFETNVCKICNDSEWDLFKIESRKDENIDKEKLRSDIKENAPISRKKRTKYYQNGKRIKPPAEPETDPLCGNRDACLDAAGYDNDSFIHCKNCPNKKSWIDI